VPGLPGFLSLSFFLLFIAVSTIITAKFTYSKFVLSKLNKIDILLQIFVLIHLLIIPFSMEPRVSIRLVFELVISTCFYYIISKSDRIAIQWLKGVPVAVFFTALLAIFQFTIDSSWPMQRYMNDSNELERLAFGEDVPAKAIGPFLHGNSLSLFLSITLPIVLGLALRKENKAYRKLFFGVFFMGVLAQVLSLSRGGLISLSIALFSMWLFTKRKKAAMKNFRKNVLYIALSAATLFVLGKSIGMVEVIKERFFSIAFEERDMASNLCRVVNLTAGFNAVRAHPFVGIGPGTSGKHFTVYGGWTGFGPHNLYLFIASERGIPALIIFLATIIIALIAVTKRYKNKGDWLVGGVFASIIAGLINGMFESVLTDIFLPFLFANLGILILFVRKSPQYND
jgi:hypothetical protein